MRGQNMNWDVIDRNLHEAGASIDSLRGELGHPDMTVGCLKVEIEHIVSHILFAWNTRHMSQRQIDALSFGAWRRHCRMYEDFMPPLGECHDEALESRPGKFRRTRADSFDERPVTQRHWVKNERQFTWWARRKKKRR